jgi:hypothetical protein
MRLAAICPASERPGGRLSARFILHPNRAKCPWKQQLAERRLVFNTCSTTRAAPLPLLGSVASNQKQIGRLRFTGSQLTFFRFLKLEMSRLTLRNRLVLGSIYGGIYIILDRDRALGNRECDHRVHVILARSNRLRPAHTYSRPSPIRGKL